MKNLKNVFAGIGIVCLVAMVIAATTGPFVGGTAVVSRSDFNTNNTALIASQTTAAQVVIAQSNGQWIAYNNGYGLNTTVSNTFTLTNNGGGSVLRFWNSDTNANATTRWNFGDSSGQTYSWQQVTDTNKWALQRQNSDTDYPILVTRQGLKFGAAGKYQTNASAGTTNVGWLNVGGADTNFVSFTVRQSTGAAISPLRIEDTNQNTLFHVRSNGVALIGTNATGWGAISNNTATTNLSLSVGANAPSIYIGAGGNVGIGTGTPMSPLNVVGPNLAQAGKGVAMFTDNNGQMGSAIIIGYTGVANNRYKSISADGSGMYFGVLADALTTLPTNVMTLLNTGNVGIGTTTPGYKLHVAGDAYLPTNAAPFTVVSNAPAVLITNLNQRALLVLKLAFDDVTGGIPSCTVVATNLISTSYFGSLSPTLSGLTLVGTVTVTNDYSYPMQTNAIFKITDTSSGGAAVRVVQALVFEQ